MSERRDILAEVLAEATNLGLAWWERIVLILAVALLTVVGKRAWQLLPKVAPDPDPTDDPGLPPMPNPPPSRGDFDP